METFTVEGILVSSPDDQVRIVTDDLVMDFHEDDVVSVTVLSPPATLDLERGQAVRLELAKGARLLDLGSAEAYRTALWRRSELFAMRTRARERGWTRSAAFTEAERAFFARYGITVDDESLL